MSKITYENKEQLNTNENIPAKNKCMASDLNEIKEVVNENDTNALYNTNVKTSQTNSDTDVYSCNYVNTQLINIIYPVGSIYMSVNNINPSALFGGTWTSWGAGKVPVGVDESDTDFNTVEKTGGAKTHTLTAQELASHNHNGTTDFAGEHAHTFNGYAPNRMATGNSDYAFVSNPQSHTDVIDASGTHQHTFTTNNTGGNQPHNNIQPYITCYMWKRTA